jgi:hypothetical protein
MGEITLMYISATSNRRKSEKKIRNRLQCISRVGRALTVKLILTKVGKSVKVTKTVQCADFGAKWWRVSTTRSVTV